MTTWRNDPEGRRLPVAREEYRERPDPAFATYGPKTRREFLGLLAST